MQKNAAIFGLMLLAAYGSARADWDCEHKSPRRLSTPAAGVTRVVVIARAGSLVVEGRGGAAEIIAAGTACSSDEAFLKRMDLVARRSGGEVRIEAVIPERDSWFGSWEASLPFTVTVPDGVELVVKDGSGPAEIRNVAAADVTDGSGDLEIENVRGNVRVNDGSGSIRMTNIGGDVRLSDGSGGIDVRSVTGGVVVDEDGSGSIDIREVRRSVVIEEDGSGGVDVADVGGDFIVRDKGKSGGIDYTRVTGQVRIPRR